MENVFKIMIFFLLFACNKEDSVEVKITEVSTNMERNENLGFPDLVISYSVFNNTKKDILLSDEYVYKSEFFKFPYLGHLVLKNPIFILTGDTLYGRRMNVRENENNLNFQILKYGEISNVKFEIFYQEIKKLYEEKYVKKFDRIQDFMIFLVSKGVLSVQYMEVKEIKTKQSCGMNLKFRKYREYDDIEE